MLTINDIDEHDKIKVAEYNDLKHNDNIKYIARVISTIQEGGKKMILVWVVDMIEPSSFASKCEIKRKGESRKVGIKNVKEIVEKEAYIN